MKQIFIKLKLFMFMLLPVAMFAQAQIWETEVQVYPKPTININATTFCQGDSATLTFTGTAPFTVTFTGSLASYTSPMTFGDLGLVLTTGILDATTGATTYTINIVAGTAGSFALTDISISDFHNCINSIENKIITVNSEPSISLTETEICQHSNATFAVVPSDATVDITSFTSTPSIGLNAPINGLGDGSTLPGGQAGNFTFSIPVGGLEIVGTGCKNLTEITDQIIVHATPTVIINDADGIVCQNDAVSVTFTGKEPFTVVWLSGDQAGLPTLYGTGGVPLINNGPLPDGTGDNSYTATVTAGSYGVFNWQGTLTDANNPACIANVSADITVNPTPTVEITSAPLCEDGELSFHFTGSGTVNSNQFTLCYGVQVATDVTVPNYGNTVTPSTIGLSDTFITSLETSTIGEAGSVSQYKAIINPGVPGKFKFILKSITSPDGCKSINPDTSSLDIDWCN